MLANSIVNAKNDKITAVFDYLEKDPGRVIFLGLRHKILVTVQPGWSCSEFHQAIFSPHQCNCNTASARCDSARKIALTGDIKTEIVLSIVTEEYLLPAPEPENSQIDSSSLVFSGISEVRCG